MFHRDPVYGEFVAVSATGSGPAPAVPPGRCPGCGAGPLEGSPAGRVWHPWECPVAVRLTAEYLAAAIGSGWRDAAQRYAARSSAAGPHNPDGPFSPEPRHWRAVWAEPDPPPASPVSIVPAADGTGVIEGDPADGWNRPGAEPLLALLRSDGSPFRPANPNHLLFGATVCRTVNFASPVIDPAPEPPNHETAR